MIVLLALLAAAPPPADFERLEENGMLAFRYAWPAAVEAEPALKAAMRTRMASERARAAAFASQMRGIARRGRFPFNRHALDTSWRVEGRTARLISLSAEIAAYTGGGHGDDRFAVLLWDLAGARPAHLSAFSDPAALRALAPRFCAAYAAAAQGESGRRACPALADRPAAPADSDGNGRFDTLRIFVATGYFDAGGLIVDVPFEPDDLARLSDGYRPAFEVPGERPRPLTGD